MSEFLTVPQAATKVGCSRSLLWKKCKDGSLPAIRVGNEYRIRVLDLEAWVKHSPSPDRKSPLPLQDGDLLFLIDGWLRYLTHVKALSPNTIELYQVLLRSYIKRLSVLEQASLTLETLFAPKALLEVFAQVPVNSFNTKQNTFIMLKSFGRYLITVEKLPASMLEALNPHKPRRMKEPRRTSLRAEQVERLFDVILSRPRPVKENACLAAMVAVMVYGGLRVSETCNLRPQDVDLEEKILFVRWGKGGKDRRVGISSKLASYLKSYEVVRAKGDCYFLDQTNKTWNRNRIAKRLKDLSRVLGVDFTAHGLRRSFATLASSGGKGINSIRIALGHTDITTTQAYLRTTEAEVVLDMASW